MEKLKNTDKGSDNAEKELRISDVSDSDLFSAEYRGDKIKIKRKFLKQGEERELLQKLKKFNLGSGHEEMKLSKIDDDNFVFRLETYTGGPTQTIYFERLK
jgi:predicted nuclease of restriction endonuclease-like (RecB) superfamily